MYLHCSYETPTSVREYICTISTTYILRLSHISSMSFLHHSHINPTSFSQEPHAIPRTLHHTVHYSHAFPTLFLHHSHIVLPLFFRTSHILLSSTHTLARVPHHRNSTLIDTVSTPPSQYPHLFRYYSHTISTWASHLCRIVTSTPFSQYFHHVPTGVVPRHSRTTLIRHTQHTTTYKGAKKKISASRKYNKVANRDFGFRAPNFRSQHC